MKKAFNFLPIRVLESAQLFWNPGADELEVIAIEEIVNQVSKRKPHLLHFIVTSSLWLQAEVELAGQTWQSDMQVSPLEHSRLFNQIVWLVLPGLYRDLEKHGCRENKRYG